jgi:glycosyltransferase involved in cell wall biosynthesis
MKKITSIVLNNFKNDSRVLKENISLQRAGYEVQVVALHEEPLAEFEKVQNIPTHRVKLKTRGWSKQKLVQLIKYVEFIYKVVKQYKKSDIVHCNDLNSLPIGVIIKKFFNRDVKIVYDAHEYETELNGLKGFQKKLVKWLEKRLIKYADKVITVSDAIADEYVKLYDIKKPALVLNTPPYKKIEKKNIFRETLDIKEEQTIFLYQGGLSKGRGIEILLEAFKSINDENAVIVFMGYGPLESLIETTSKEYKNIYFHEAVTPEVLLNYTSSADFGFLFYENTCLNHYYCSPNKMFEYLMAEIPVIVSNLYEMKRLVESNKIGTVAKENTPNGLKEAIEKAVKLDKEELKTNIQKLKTIYNWEEQEKVLLEVYKDLYAN